MQETSPNYGVSLKNNKGSEKWQSAAKKRQNGDSNPTHCLAFSVAAATSLCLKRSELRRMRPSRLRAR
ncbi:uncharacterized protein N7482_006050 [Penicillium canariense]|uniref:Uncharacterized protein n=1 Tax=Penicillium canariense TaxID=189055 RepID=A0A9W9I5Y3_9EURO|nr:uncharacterized protein N7482_006050 [Penicillium canariense]KAJ5167269.1 hypothetical protein N7482_006050 [Penicillium canariense]